MLLIETQQDMLRDQVRHRRRQRGDDDEAGPARARSWCRRRSTPNNGQQMLTGSDPSARWSRRSCPYDEVDVLGLNCAFGPYELAESTRLIAENWPRLVSALPNAGLPVMVDGKQPLPDDAAGFHEGHDAASSKSSA